jgi:hypothetical protein
MSSRWFLDRVADSSVANRGADNASASRGHSSSRRRSRRRCRGTVRLGHAPWPSIGRLRNSCNLKRPVYSWRTTRRHRTDCEAGGGFLNGKFGSDQIIIASNSTAVIPTIRNANAATSWSSQCLYRRMKIVPPLKNERGMNAALKTQQSLNLLLQAGHTRTRSELVTLCCHPLVKVEHIGVSDEMGEVVEELSPEHTSCRRRGREAELIPRPVRCITRKLGAKESPGVSPEAFKERL